MNIIVTGGAGFIGSAVVRYLIGHTNHTVVNVDKLTYASSLQSVAEVGRSGRYFFEKVDICDSIALSRVFQRYQPDVVMHLAAESHVDRSIAGPEEFINTNIIGTYRLLEVVRKYWEELAEDKKTRFRLHHISTDEVFGDLSSEESPFTEQNPYRPSSPYSASKASSDHLVRAWHRTYGLPVLITNCSNNYGPFQFPEKLIPLTIISALAGRPIPIFGKGDQIRDWLFVEDHAKALYLVITKGRAGETYNIGGGNEKQNIEVVTQICDVLQELAPVNRPYRNLITSVEDRPGHDRRYAVDMTKITKELGWQPEESFESGLRKSIQWYLTHPDLCNSVGGAQDSEPSGKVL